MKARLRSVLLLSAAAAAVLPSLSWIRRPLAEVLRARSLAARAEWQLDAAARLLRWAVRLEPSGSARLELAGIEQLRGDFTSAEREIQALLATPALDPSLQARALNAAGIDRFSFGEADSALERHQRGRALARQVGERRVEAQALIGRARVLYHLKGRVAEPLADLQEALRIAREVRDEGLEADALRNLGVVHWWHKRELPVALRAFYRPALEIYRRRDDRHGAAVTLSNIALIHEQQGDLFQFLRHQEESIRIKEAIGDRAGLADSFLYLGAHYANLENHRKAHELYTRSLELSRRGGYRLGENEAETRLAGVDQALGEFDHAVARLRAVLAREGGNALLASYRLERLVDCYRLKGDIPRAWEAYGEWLAVERSAGVAWPCARSALQGRIHLSAAEWRAAVEHLARAEESLLSDPGSFAGSPLVMLIGMKVDLAAAHEALSERAEALRYLLEAAALESQTLDTAHSRLVRGQNRRLYDRLFALLLDPGPSPAGGAADDGGGRTQLAFRQLEQLRYRSLRNLVVAVSGRASPRRAGAEEGAERARAEGILHALRERRGHGGDHELLRAYGQYEDLLLRAELAGPRYGMVRDARSPEPGSVQAGLGRDTALVEYLFAGDKAFALVLTHRGLAGLRLPATRQGLSAQVKLFRALLFDGSGSEDWRPVARNLRDALIDPLERAHGLEGIERLALVPFGVLHDLPFAALTRGEGPAARALIEDYTLFYLPSAALLRRPRPRATEAKEHLLAFGRDGGGEPNLPALSHAAAEARAVADMLGGEVRTGVEASETALKQRGGGFRILHLATHAVSEPAMPLLSRLALEASPEDDGNLTVPEILELRLEAELVTLGACWTALAFSASGSEGSEVDRIGLVDAFLHAGAGTVLASLMPLDDRSTLDLMKAFYRNLGSSDKAGALRAAQEEMLRGRWPHPRYWAPVVLVGDDR